MKHNAKEGLIFPVVKKTDGTKLNIGDFVLTF
jgi:hypothetical protein